MFAAPIVYALGRKAGTVYTLIVLLAAMAPDLDRYLPYVTHHGLTHTFAFAIIIGFIGGIIATIGILVYHRIAGPPRFSFLIPRHVLLYTTVALFTGSASHVVADIFVMLPGTQPVSPFWPVNPQHFHIELIPLGAPLRNGLLFLIGILTLAAVCSIQSKNIS
ncbi:hypothetical protein DMJ13_23390 [halophilic archaeon]|nr:hypothetical protein DMJ13_23390 [halophilic archaeon]